MPSTLKSWIIWRQQDDRSSPLSYLEQTGPHLVNSLNSLIQKMAMFDTETTLLLGYNNNNTIGMIGSFGGSDVGTIWNSYYILDIDHVDHKEVDANVILIKELR